jgi:hypothetical protein
MSEIQVRLPLPRTQNSDWRGAHGSYPVAGKRVAIVNDGWGSADDLAVVLERMLSQRYGVAHVEHFRANRNKDHDSERTSPQAQEAFVARVVASADAAIAMLGNCGGCTAWTCNTSAELRRRGVNSAAIVTGLFRPEAEFLLAKTNKMPEHPLIVLEDRFEFTDPMALEEAAVGMLQTLFGAPANAASPPAVDVLTRGTR